MKCSNKGHNSLPIVIRVALITPPVTESNDNLQYSSTVSSLVIISGYLEMSHPLVIIYNNLTIRPILDSIRTPGKNVCIHVLCCVPLINGASCHASLFSTNVCDGDVLKVSQTTKWTKFSVPYHEILCLPCLQDIIMMCHGSEFSLITFLHANCEHHI